MSADAIAAFEGNDFVRALGLFQRLIALEPAVGWVRHDVIGAFQDWTSKLTVILA